MNGERDLSEIVQLSQLRVTTCSYKQVYVIRWWILYQPVVTFAVDRLGDKHHKRALSLLPPPPPPPTHTHTFTLKVSFPFSVLAFFVPLLLLLLLLRHEGWWLKWVCHSRSSRPVFGWVYVQYHIYVDEAGVPKVIETVCQKSMRLGCQKSVKLVCQRSSKLCVPKVNEAGMPKVSEAGVPKVIETMCAKGQWGWGAEGHRNYDCVPNVSEVRVRTSSGNSQKRRMTRNHSPPAPSLTLRTPDTTSSAWRHTVSQPITCDGLKSPHAGPHQPIDMLIAPTFDTCSLHMRSFVGKQCDGWWWVCCIITPTGREKNAFVQRERLPLPSSPTVNIADHYWRSRGCEKEKKRGRRKKKRRELVETTERALVSIWFCSCGGIFASGRISDHRLVLVDDLQQEQCRRQGSVF